MNLSVAVIDYTSNRLILSFVTWAWSNDVQSIAETIVMMNEETYLDLAGPV